ncbi:C4-dicarboxylate ABC transporter permease [Robertmurraya siralis]|uniref:C4-dicarboxylate ABC transporter permease n=1 Tax=Robertmurraya siralis TaxID=77777 RepID=A0A919WKE8_9BACI|nr:TRAP transporter small permease [Robertmurraya siralis]GIN63384.1 C4-dicarboxylate ABC transporter permease [Robertmurraya siralis]
MSKFFKLLNKGIEYLLMVLVALMVISCVWQVMSRYIFGQASAQTEELMRYSIIWVSIIGGAYVYGEKGHLAITFFADKLNKALAKVISIFIDAAICIFSAIVLIYGGAQIVSATMIQISPGMGLPMGYMYMALPIAGLLFILYSIDQITTKLKTKNHLV